MGSARTAVSVSSAQLESNRRSVGRGGSDRPARGRCGFATVEGDAPCGDSDMQSKRSSWQDAEVALRFLDERRAAIPYALDQLDMLLRLVRHFVGAPRRVLDLGCGDGLLARTVLFRYHNANAVLIDHSEPMLQRAREAMTEFSDRCDIRYGELADPLDRVVEGRFDL